MPTAATAIPFRPSVVRLNLGEDRRSVELYSLHAGGYCAYIPVCVSCGSLSRKRIGKREDGGHWILWDFSREFFVIGDNDILFLSVIK